MEITSTASTAGSDNGSPARIGLADSFDGFLKLLTTQLRSQDPLSPMDATQFTEQLVQFTEVEQSIKTNDALGELVAMVQADQISRSIDYLGAEVDTESSTFRLDANGPASLHYRLDQPAADVVVNIFDETGTLTASLPGAPGAGSHSLLWDGRTTSGVRSPDGTYRIEVAAIDGTGEPVPVSTTMSGIVDGVELGSGEMLLSVDGVLVPLDAITAVRRSQTAS